MAGWVMLHRSMTSWEWYTDSETKALFLHILLMANHKDGSWQGKAVERGQFITGRKTLSAQTGLSEKSVRTRLKRLQNSGEISIETASKFSIITVCNYNEYQSEEKDNGQQDGQQDGQQRASKGPAKGQQRATNNNEKNEDNVNNENNNNSGGECPDSSTGNNPEAGTGGSGTEGGSASGEKKTPLQLIREMRPGWWTAEEWEELITHRSSLKASKGQRAYRLLNKEFNVAKAAGETAQTILDDMISGKGWAGYKFEWVENRRGSHHANGKGASSPFKIDQDKPVENWLE